MSHESKSDVQWTAYKGKVYDVAAFLTEHPGGSIVRLALQRDCTDLVEAYHPSWSQVKIEAYLKSSCTLIGDYKPKPETSAKVTQKQNYMSGEFFATVQARVEGRLKELGMTRHSDVLGMFESIVTIILYLVASYFKMYGSIFSAVCVGILTGRLGFLMHMGNHHATSQNGTINWLHGCIMDLIGASSVNWAYDHNVSHHQDPNDLHKDNDANIGAPYVRLHPDSKWAWYQKYQHIYTFIVMGLGFFNWAITDFVNFKTGQVGFSRYNPTKSDWMHMLVFKTAWLTLHAVLPVLVGGQSVGQMMLTFTIFMFIGAEYLENTFIVNHIQADLHPPSNAHWAVKQVLGSSNWCSGSVFWNFFSGGLNHQVEHHLFPSLAHYKYPYVADVVEKTCKEFGLPYVSYKSFPAAWWTMNRFMKKLGEEEHPKFA